MKLFSWLMGNRAGVNTSQDILGAAPSIQDKSPGSDDHMPLTVINPASGLPMTDGIGGVDIAGNVYGVNNAAIDLGGDISTMGHSSSFDMGGGGFGSSGF